MTADLRLFVIVIGLCLVGPEDCGFQFLGGRPVPQRARQALSMDRLEIASAALGMVQRKIGHFPRSEAFSMVPSAACDFKPEICRRDHYFDGWGRQPSYWSNGEHFVVLSSGRDGVLDVNYVDLLAKLDLSDPRTFCSRVVTGHRDDMLLFDGQECAGGIKPHEPAQ